MLGTISASTDERFSDGVSSVLTKKRNIIMEVSPSPPPEDAVDNADFSEISGFATAAPAAAKGKSGGAARFLEDGMCTGEFPQLGVGNSPFSRPNDDGLVDSLENQRAGRRVRVTLTEDCRKQADMLKNGCVMELHVTSFNLNEPDGHVNATSEGMKESTELALGSNAANGGFGNQNVQPFGCSLVDREKKGKGLLLRLGSGSFNDDRSHWDLNSPMDLWVKQSRVHDAESGQGSAGKVPAGTSCKKSLESLDGVQLQTLVVDAKGKIRKAEQDMLSKGFQADQSARELDFLGGLASEENAEPDTCLGLRTDMFPGPGKKPMKRARVSNNDVRSEESFAERGLNLCMASFERACYSANDVSTLQVEDGKGWEGKLPDDNSETQLLQSDRLPGRLVIQSEVCLSDHVEDYPALKYDGELVTDGLDAIDGICVEENQSGSLKTNDHLDARVKCPVFSQARDEHNVETMDEDRSVHDESIGASRKVDGAVLVKGTNTTREKPATLEVGLGKHSTKYTAEAGYAGDHKHNDEDEPVAGTAKELIGQADSGFQDRQHRKTREEREVGHGDSDCRDVVDDVDIDSDERGEGGRMHEYQ